MHEGFDSSRIFATIWRPFSGLFGTRQKLIQVAFKAIGVDRLGYASVAARLHDAVLIGQHRMSGDCNDRKAAIAGLITYPRCECEAVLLA